MHSLFWIIGLLSLATPRQAIPSSGDSRKKDSGPNSPPRNSSELIHIHQKEYQLSPIIVRRLRALGMTWQIRSNSLLTSEPLIDENGQIDWDQLKDQVKLK